MHETGRQAGRQTDRRYAVSATERCGAGCRRGLPCWFALGGAGAGASVFFARAGRRRGRRALGLCVVVGVFFRGVGNCAARGRGRRGRRTQDAAESNLDEVHEQECAEAKEGQPRQAPSESRAAARVGKRAQVSGVPKEDFWILVRRG